MLKLLRTLWSRLFHSEHRIELHTERLQMLNYHSPETEER